eukprot:6200055-Pleurochrysis_carterae.AAC.6
MSSIVVICEKMRTRWPVMKSFCSIKSSSCILPHDWTSASARHTARRLQYKDMQGKCRSRSREALLKTHHKSMRAAKTPLPRRECKRHFTAGERASRSSANSKSDSSPMLSLRVHARRPF